MATRAFLRRPLSPTTFFSHSCCANDIYLLPLLTHRDDARCLVFGPAIQAGFKDSNKMIRCACYTCPVLSTVIVI